MPHRIRQQCFNNMVVNIAACQLQGWMLHLWKIMHYQGWYIPAYAIHFRQIDVSLDKANDFGDKDLLHMIRGSDNKCSDMVEDYFQYHMVCMNSYLTMLGHPQEKACESTPTCPWWCCNDAVDIMPRWLPLQRLCHFLCYIFKEWIQKSQTTWLRSQPCPRCLPSGWRLSHTKSHRNSIAHTQRKQEPGDCSILK